MMNMISNLNADTKVPGLTIRINSRNRWSQEILTDIANKYYNIHHLVLWDYKDKLDDLIHTFIKYHISVH